MALAAASCSPSPSLRSRSQQRFRRTLPPLLPGLLAVLLLLLLPATSDGAFIPSGQQRLPRCASATTSSRHRASTVMAINEAGASIGASPYDSRRQLRLDARNRVAGRSLLNKTKHITSTGGRAGGRVLGLGVCGVDMLASVDKYPEADAKIRSTDFQVQGGGNAGNTLTGLSRLGVQAEIMTKVGEDAYGKMITDELSQDGLDVSRVIRKPGITSPFTYVIVDVAGQTRTCIHTPSEGK